MIFFAWMWAATASRSTSRQQKETGADFGPVLEQTTCTSTPELSLGSQQATADLHVPHRASLNFLSNAFKIISLLRDNATPPLPTTNQYWILPITARTGMRFVPTNVTVLIHFTPSLFYQLHRHISSEQMKNKAPFVQKPKQSMQQTPI